MAIIPPAAYRYGLFAASALLIAFMVLLAYVRIVGEGGAPQSENSPQELLRRISARSLTLPLYFEKNEGQIYSEDVKYLSKARSHTLYFLPHEIAMTFNTASHMLQIQFPGANSNTILTGVEEQEYKCHYYIGNEPEKWHANVPNFAKVKYENLYPGIDAVFYGNQQTLEYDFRVSPGRDPQQARLHFEGAQKLRIDDEGNLCIQMDESTNCQMLKPVVYQITDEEKISIDGHFILLAQNDVGFSIGDYDSGKELVIDPVISYSTYFGGGQTNGNGIALDSSNNIYITGNVATTDLPTMNAFQGSYQGGSLDAFVTKFNAGGASLAYSTYLGGSGQDSGAAIAVDSSGSAYVTGITQSSNFPTSVGAFQTTLPSGHNSGFVTKFNSSGTLGYSTYLGGNSQDNGRGIAVDSSGNAYITGSTFSNNFPTTAGAYQTALIGSDNAFITSLNPTGTGLNYSTYLGSNDVTGFAIAVDSSGNAYVTGIASPNFPTTAGAFQTSATVKSAFITKINPSGTGLVYSTFLGGNKGSTGHGICVDSSGNAYVAGQTSSSDFPVTVNAFQSTLNGNEDAFVTKMNASGSALIYSTFLGGSIDLGADSFASGIAIDANDNFYVTGQTNAINFPIVAPVQSTYQGGATRCFCYGL